MIFSDQCLRNFADGDLADVPLANVVPDLAMEVLQLRARVRNLQETVKQSIRRSEESS